MIRIEGDVMRVEGPVTLQTVPALLEEAAAHLAKVTRIDFGGVTDIDSAAVALALEWQRQAAERSASVQLENFPEAMQNLAGLYGVSELLQSPAP